MDDHQIIILLSKDDRGAFNYVYNTYAPLIANRLLQMVKLVPVVEELHQDVFVRFWNHRHQLDHNVNIQAYLFRIARNLVIDFYRKAAKNTTLKAELYSHIEEMYDHIEAMVFEKENEELLELWISSLPPQRQRIYRMIRFDGKSYAETAHHFGISLSTVKDHMAKSSEFLKSKINDNYVVVLLPQLLALFFK